MARLLISFTTLSALVLSGCGPAANLQPRKAGAQEPAEQERSLDTATFNPNGPAQPAVASHQQDTVSPCIAPPDFMIGVERPTRPSRALPLSFSAYPQFVSSGQAVRLTWAAAGVSFVSVFRQDVSTGSQTKIGDFAPNSNVYVTPTADTIYSAQAGDGSTTVSQSSQVWVDAPLGTLSTSFAASPTTFVAGGSAALVWKTANATSVVIDNGIGPVPLNGALKVTPSATTTYTLTASCGGINVQEQVTLTQVPQPAGMGNVKHIIFMMQENRSFDHYFGKLGDYRVMQGLPNDVDGLPASAQNYQEDGVTSIQPYHLGTQCIEELSTSWNEAHWQFNLHDPTSTVPRMDGFVATAQGYARFQNENDTAGIRAMGWYDWTDLPYYYFMATEFATSDRFFSPVASRSTPNRLYAYAATSDGYVFDPPHTLSNKTIFQLLDDAGITWKIYYSSAYPDGRPATTLDTFFDYAQQHRAQIVPVSQYKADVANNALPQFAFIEHGSLNGLDEHPGGSKIDDGARYVSELINPLMQSAAWPDSIFILSFDEAGGLYDHVPSPTDVPNPDGQAPKDIGANDIPGDFTRDGFRVPLIVVSPYARKNYVSHNTMDYTAVLKLVETRFGLPSLNARDAFEPDMSEFFDFENPSWLAPPTPPDQPSQSPCYLDHLP